jgi:Outer membrane protein beta-barrel domain
MKRIVLAVAVLLAVASPAFAQAPARTGFTVLANLGVGFQNDDFYEETATGLAGLNFGAGWFLTDNVAVLGRISGTRATFDTFDVTQTSAVYGGSIQYWLNNWASIEGGVGLGRWSDSDGLSENGWGLIVAFNATVFQRGRHHVRAGVEWAPVFTDTSNIQNIGVTVGYQFVK